MQRMLTSLSKRPTYNAVSFEVRHGPYFVLQTIIAQKGVNDVVRAIDALIDCSVALFFIIVSHNFALLL